MSLTKGNTYPYFIRLAAKNGKLGYAICREYHHGWYADQEEACKALAKLNEEARKEQNNDTRRKTSL